MIGVLRRTVVSPSLDSNSENSILQQSFSGLQSHRSSFSIKVCFHKVDYERQDDHDSELRALDIHPDIAGSIAPFGGFEDNSSAIS